MMSDVDKTEWDYSQDNPTASQWKNWELGTQKIISGQ